MAKGFKHGTSGKKENPLNFAVVAYPSEVELNTATPGDTTITTIGVVTTNPINGWFFASEQPSDMAEGEVWFRSGTFSTVEFNALKENSVMVYPLIGKQMISGELKDVTTKSYKDGQWVGWWNGELYNDGYEYTNVLGANGFYKTTGIGTVTKNATNIVLLATTNSDTVKISHDNAIDLTNFNKLLVEVNSQGQDTYRYIMVAKNNNVTRENAEALKKIAVIGNGVVDLDLSTVNGLRYILIEAFKPELTVSKVWLE